MKLSLLFVGVLLAFYPSKSFATPQQRDILIYERKSYPIYGEPLEAYFNRNPERRPRFCGGLSSLWRGYVAEIEVLKDELILKDVKIHTVNPSDPNCQQESKISEVVPEGGRFKFGWFSGELLAAYGGLVGNDVDFYAIWKIYSKYSLFSIEKGKLKTVRHFTNAEYQNYLTQRPRKESARRLD